MNSLVRTALVFCSPLFMFGCVSLTLPKPPTALPALSVPTLVVEEEEQIKDVRGEISDAVKAFDSLPLSVRLDLSSVRAKLLLSLSDIDRRANGLH